jgi:hypothetical protein
MNIPCYVHNAREESVTLLLESMGREYLLAPEQQVYLLLAFTGKRWPRMGVTQQSLTISSDWHIRGIQLEGVIYNRYRHGDLSELVYFVLENTSFEHLWIQNWTFPEVYWMPPGSQLLFESPSDPFYSPLSFVFCKDVAPKESNFLPEGMLQELESRCGGLYSGFSYIGVEYWLPPDEERVRAQMWGKPPGWR